MPRSKEGKKRPPVNEENLKNALEAVTTDDPEKKLTYREASKVYKVSRSTLTRHLEKYKDSDNFEYNYSINYAVKQIFTAEEELSLVVYIGNVARMNFGLTKKGVRLLAFQFAKANNKKIPDRWNEEEIAGEEWMRLFLKRHSQELSIRKPEATSLSRMTSFNRTNVALFFNNVKEVHNKYGPIPPEKIWNVDETGISTVQGQSKIVAPKGVKQIGSATSAERGSLVTVIAAANAIGNSLPPLLIFPRVHFKDRMLSGGPAGCVGAANPTGWSNEECFIMFMDHFLKNVRSSKDDRVLLILDNHETHLTPAVLDKTSDAGVVMVTFPPHTSNKLQPLDISVYGPLKTYYNQAVEAWLLNNKGKTFDIYCVAEALGKAFPRAFTPNNVMSGFRKSGVFPFNEDIFTDHDYLCSYVSDRPLETSSDGPPALENATTDGASTETTCSLSCSASSSSKLPRSSVPDFSKPSTSAGPGLFTTPKRPINEEKSKTFISPEEVQPYPKADSRKRKKQGGRKPGRTMIATDTPEKNAIKAQKEKKSKNTETKKKVSKNLKKSFDQPSNEKRKRNQSPKISLDETSAKKTQSSRLTQKLKHKEPSSSSSSDEEALSFVSTDDEDSAGDEETCLYCCSSKISDKSGEEWCKCIYCGRWVHFLCAGIEGKEWKEYLCDFCRNRQN